MVKKRDPRTVQQTAAQGVDDDKLKSFMDNAEGYKGSDEAQAADLDPQAKRDFKQINVRMNEYEYSQLMAAAGRDHLKLQDFLRVSGLRRGEETGRH